MKLPWWLKFKKDKKGVLIYDIKSSKLYRSESSLLYLILKLDSLHYSEPQIVNYLSKTCKISIHKANQLYNNCVLKLKPLFTEKNTDTKMNFENIVYNTYDFETPLAISLILTYRCNLKCKHCLVGNFRYNKLNEMKLKEIEKLAAQMEQYEVFKVALNGGEPLVRKDLREILRVFHQHKIPIEISTNGIGLSKEMIELMNSYNVVTYILSLEGSNKETNDFIRGEETFDKAVSAISNIKRYSTAFELHVEITYGKHNLNQVEDIIKMLTDLGVNKIKFARLKPWNWGSRLCYLVPTQSDIVYLNEKIWNLQTKNQSDIVIEGDVPNLKRKKMEKGCNINVAFEILPDGVVLPCRIFEQKLDKNIILGNIKSRNIFEIWTSSRAKIIRNATLRLREKIYSSTCTFAQFCAINYCIAENFIKFGEFIPPSTCSQICNL